MSRAAPGENVTDSSLNLEQAIKYITLVSLLM